MVAPMMYEPPTPRHPGESASERYLRQIRNAVVTIAVIFVLAAIFSLIGAIAQYVELSHVFSTLNDIVNGNGLTG